MRAGEKRLFPSRGHEVYESVGEVGAIERSWSAMDTCSTLIEDHVTRLKLEEMSVPIMINESQLPVLVHLEIQSQKKRRKKVWR